MHTSAVTTGQPSRLAHLFDRWQTSRLRWASLDNIEAMSAADIAQMAKDVGLTSEEFVIAVRRPDGPTSLLDRRLAALDLDQEEIRRLSVVLLGELRLTCARCPDKCRCADDMAEDPKSPGWESYCPNSGTLRTLT